MKGCKHQDDFYGLALEQIEQMIECIEPDKPIRISDITRRIKPEIRNGDITRATRMLLKKYGITYLED